MPSGPALDTFTTLSSRNPGGDRVSNTLRQLAVLLLGDLTRVELLLAQSPSSRASNCTLAAQDLIASGGKRLRPALTLLTYRLASGASEAADAAVELAAAVELLHTATLLHDDVIDEARLRRGKPCARVCWGNTVSVIAGDLLLVQALDRVHSLGDRRLDGLLNKALRQLVEGEVEQLERRGVLECDPQQFERIAQRKTASLFVLAAVGGSLLGGAAAEQAADIEEFAVALGLAFQLDDDLLDLCSSPQALGKAIGQDLATGSVTLPLADVLQQSPTLREELLANCASGEPLAPEIAEQILDLSARPGALDRCRALVRGYVQRALQIYGRLRVCPEREVLAGLVELLAQRALGNTAAEEAMRRVS